MPDWSVSAALARLWGLGVAEHLTEQFGENHLALQDTRIEGEILEKDGANVYPTELGQRMLFLWSSAAEPSCSKIAMLRHIARVAAGAYDAAGATTRAPFTPATHQDDNRCSGKSFAISSRRPGTRRKRAHRSVRRMTRIRRSTSTPRGPLVHKWVLYFEIYHRHFARFRGESPVVIEIGVSKG